MRALPVTRATTFAVVCLLGAAAALGIAHIALLPPWEGFDEEAHYSALQEIVDLRRLPDPRSARLSQFIADYAASAPTRYRNLPVARPGTLTYRVFFESGGDVIARGRDLVHAVPAIPRRYVAGVRPNWERQHPPLYYLVLAPVYWLVRDLGLGAQLFVLRALSYLFAWLALALGVAACARAPSIGEAAGSERGWPILGVAAWPLLFPGWFPEMARLGNDSLCALLAALVWWSTARAVGEGPGLRYALTAGTLLGLGCLTKAFFVPLTAGLLAFWLVRQWRSGGRRTLLRLARHAAVAGGLIAAIAGWWYVGHWLAHGVGLPSTEVIRLEAQGGLIEGLRQHFAVRELARFVVSFVVRFAWPSTWSLARPSYVLLAPLGLLAVAAAIGYVLAARRSGATRLRWLPAWLTVPVLVGFGYHMLVVIALWGRGAGFGGYYLHLLVAPLGFALGLAIRTAWRHRGARVAGTLLAAYSVVFAVAISWAQTLLFAGVLSRSSARFYEAPAVWPPLLGVPEALGRLATIAFPLTGAVAWLLGGSLALVGLVAAHRAASRFAASRGDAGGVC